MPLTRRSLLLNGGILTGAAAASVSGAPGADSGKRRLKIVVAGGHPGDPEYACGGTVAKLTQQGHEVVLLYLNDGAWPPTPAATRIGEAKHACEILKARPAYANQTNGHAVVDAARYDEFQKIIAAENPDAVFNQWFVDNHRDHRAIANLTYDAWNQLKRKFALYYYEVSDGEDTMQFPSPTHYVDITSVADTKKAACYAHASQNPDFFYGVQDAVAVFRGFAGGYKRAEAYLMQIPSPHDIFGMTGLSAR